MAVLVKQSIRKVADNITVSIVAKVTIGVRILKSEGLLVQGLLEVRILEGDSEGADVGGPGGQLAAVGRDRENGNTWPRRLRRDEVTRAGGVLRRRGAWR